MDQGKCISSSSAWFAGSLAIACNDRIIVSVSSISVSPRPAVVPLVIIHKLYQHDYRYHTDDRTTNDHFHCCSTNGNKLAWPLWLCANNWYRLWPSLGVCMRAFRVHTLPSIAVSLSLEFVWLNCWTIWLLYCSWSYHHCLLLMITSTSPQFENYTMQTIRL